MTEQQIVSRVILHFAEEVQLNEKAWSERDRPEAVKLYIEECKQVQRWAERRMNELNGISETVGIDG